MKKIDLLFSFVIFCSTVVLCQPSSKMTITPSVQEKGINRAAKIIEFTYKIPKEYAYTPGDQRVDLSECPEELCRTVSNVVLSQWTHEDSECILFIKSTGEYARLKKSREEIPDYISNRIRHVLNMGNSSVQTTNEQMEELNKIVTYWSTKKAKKIFNAHHVLTYPINEEKAIYQGKYAHRMDMTIIKWGESITVSFLLTDKGYKRMNKYVKDVEGVFRFND